MLVRAELGITSPTGSDTGFKPSTAMLTLPQTGTARERLTELQPERIAKI